MTVAGCTMFVVKRARCTTVVVHKLTASQFMHTVMSDGLCQGSLSRVLGSNVILE